MILGTTLDELFPYNIPWKLRWNSIDKLFYSNSVMDDLVYINIYPIKSFQLFLTSELKLTLNWKSVYNEDFSTATILKGPINHKLNGW